VYGFSSLCGCSSEGKSSAGSNETDSNVLAAIHDHASPGPDGAGAKHPKTPRNCIVLKGWTLCCDSHVPACL
jgi:hypothetical protein